MSEQPPNLPEQPDELMDAWENTVRETARHFAYPPTPDIAGGLRVRQQKPAPRQGMRALRMAAAALLALAVVTLAVPEARAFVLEVLRIGAVRIFLVEQTATPTLTATHPAQENPRPTNRPFPTRRPDPTPYASALDLPGETTLANAAARLGQPILLPTYLADLGAPDHVYVENLGGVVVTVVWTQPDDPTKVRIVLQMLDASSTASKYYPWEGSNQQSTAVNGRHAVWLTEVHAIYYFTMQNEVSRTVNDNVLIWERDGLTYRMETDLSLTEAVKVAESLAGTGGE